MKVQTIQEFRFNKAEYLIRRENEELMLQVDYKNNTLAVKKISNEISVRLEVEAREIGADLLKRKHGINFAKPRGFEQK